MAGEYHAEPSVVFLTPNPLQGKKVDGKVGLFPKSHIIPALLTPEYVYATYDFYPQHRDEIHLRAGDRIEVVQKYEDGWLQVSIVVQVPLSCTQCIQTRFTGKET